MDSLTGVLAQGEEGSDHYSSYSSSFGFVRWKKTRLAAAQQTLIIIVEGVVRGYECQYLI